MIRRRLPARRGRSHRLTCRRRLGRHLLVGRSHWLTCRRRLGRRVLGRRGRSYWVTCWRLPSGPHAHLRRTATGGAGLGLGGELRVEGGKLSSQRPDFARPDPDCRCGLGDLRRERPAEIGSLQGEPSEPRHGLVHGGPLGVALRQQRSPALRTLVTRRRRFDRVGSLVNHFVVETQLSLTACLCVSAPRWPPARRGQPGHRPGCRLAGQSRP